MSVTYDAGIATSYAAAVAGGYTGTKEQYYAEQAQFAINAQRVAQDRAAVEQITTTFNTVTAPKAIQDVTDEGNTQVQRVKDAGDEYLEDIDSRIDDAVADLKDAYEQLDTDKADTDGTYPDMTVGMAEQLDSDNYTEDSEPYHFRKSGGGNVRVGDREIDRIVGGTVAWNQLILDENKDYTNSNLTDTRTPFNLSIQNIISPVVVAYNTIISTTGRFGKVFKVTQDIGSGIRIKHNGSVVDIAMYLNYDLSMYKDHVYVFNMNVTGIDPTTLGGLSVEDMTLSDLTQDFGSTIADYIYSLETATAGAGVAFLHRYIDIDTYHPFDAGTLKSVEGLVSHDMIGFNQWDEEWQNGYYGPYNGDLTESNQYICSKNSIHVFPATTYYIKTSGVAFEICEYDVNGVFLRQLRSNIADETFTTDSDTHYIQIGSHSSGAMTNYDPTAKPICINLSDPAKNGTYKPYEKHSYPLDNDVTLRGVFKLVDGKLVADGDEYASDGTVTRRYGIVDLGTLNWNTAITNRAFANVPNIKIPSSTSLLANIITENNYMQKPATTTLSEAGQFAVINQDRNILFYYDGTLPSGYMVYELATHATESADPFTSPQWVDGSGTEQYVSTSIVPIGHYTQYPENLKQKIEGLPWDFASLIAPTEATYKATRAYSTGNLFIINNILYKATTSIASGATITPNTNCTQTTLAAVIAAL